MTIHAGNLDEGIKILFATRSVQRPMRHGHGGVWVLSRYPLTDYQEIEFDGCSSFECFSRKGALLVSGTCGATPFRLIATHLQGEEGPVITEKNQAIRDKQMLQNRDRLITPHLQKNVPFIICGDFGTPRMGDGCGVETESYREMLTTLGVENGPELRITLWTIPDWTISSQPATPVGATSSTTFLRAAMALI